MDKKALKRRLEQLEHKQARETAAEPLMIQGFFSDPDPQRCRELNLSLKNKPKGFKEYSLFWENSTLKSVPCIDCEHLKVDCVGLAR